MRRAIFLGLALLSFGCGRSALEELDGGAGGGLGGAGGSAVGGGGGGGSGGGVAQRDGGATFDAVELRSGVEVHAVALEAADGGFLALWVESDDVTMRLVALALDERGEYRNLDQVVWETPTASSGSFAAMIPGALRPVGPGRWQVTAVMGPKLVIRGVDDWGFRTQAVLETFSSPGASWALETAGGVFERAGGTSLFRALPDGSVTTLPATLNDGPAIGANSDGGLALVSSSATGGVALETLVTAHGGRAWDSLVLAPPPAGPTTARAIPVALEASPEGWIAAWAERSPTNPRTVDLRVKRPGAPATRVDDETAWLSTGGDLVLTPGGRWAVAWTGRGESANDRVRFGREGGASVCVVNTAFGNNHDAGPIALAARASGRIGVLWAEPLLRQPSLPRRARLLFRSLGEDFCP